MKDACKQASDLLAQWAPPDPEDALELLGPKYDAYGPQKVVRKYAVARLKEAPDDDLVLYLLQLVQALKYEDLGAVTAEGDVSNEELAVGPGSASWAMGASSPAHSVVAMSEERWVLAWE